MTGKFYIILILIVFCLYCPSSLSANEGTEEIIGPQLAFEPPDFIIPRALEIKFSPPSKMEIKYIIENDSYEDWRGVLRFDLPGYRWKSPVDWYQDRSFKELAVYVDGHRIKYLSSSQSYLNGIEITKILNDSGVDPNLVQKVGDCGIGVEATLENKTKYQELYDNGLIYSIPEPRDSNHKFHITPLWETENHYSWVQIFQARKKTEIVYKYNALYGVSLLLDTDYIENRKDPFIVESGFNDIRDWFGSACLDFNKVLKFMKYKIYLVFWNSIEPSRIKWRHPIDKLNINVTPIDKNSKHLKIFPNLAKDLLVSTCLNGKNFIGQPVLRIKKNKFIFDDKLVILLFSLYSLK